MTSPQNESHPQTSVSIAGDIHPTMAEGSPETRPPPFPLFLRITLVGSAVLGAVALLPYALLRTRMTRMEQHIDRLVAMSAATERDLQRLLELSAVRRGEHKQLGGLIAEAKNSMEEVRRAGERRESEQRTMNDRLLRGAHDVKAIVERAEAAAEARHVQLAGTEWRRDLLNKLRWTAGTDKK